MELFELARAVVDADDVYNAAAVAFRRKCEELRIDTASIVGIRVFAHDLVRASRKVV